MVSFTEMEGNGGGAGESRALLVVEHVGLEFRAKVRGEMMEFEEGHQEHSSIKEEKETKD